MTKIRKIKQIPIKKVIDHLNLKINSQNKVHCPAHEDRTPSLQIYEKTNSFYCFSCSTGGSVIDLVRLVRNYSIAKAIQELEGLL